MDNVVEIAAGAVGGSGLAILIAKMAMQKAFTDIEKAKDMCHDILKELATIQIRIKNMEALQPVINEQERRLLLLENRHDRGYRRNDFQNGS